MSDWRYGRYFLLEEDVRSLFQWLNENIGGEWTVDVLGVCPNEDKLILNAVFGSEKDIRLFQKDYIGDQSRYASLYNNRRKPEYKWPEKVERRSSSERRADKNRRSPKRQDSRRLEDIVKRALIKKRMIRSADVEQLKAS
tara:strand:+ start:4602 stop:5021 length:420 start_codon:yes stop_codon:yes gene_type:complete